MANYVINAVAPTRVCDVGGWTDTHFAVHGAVFNIAIYPYVEVQVYPHGSDGKILINAENFGESFSINPDDIVYEKHPLLEAAIKIMEIPSDVSLRINIFSYTPPGASMGTSAAVSVALIGALAALADKHYTPHEVAALAHSIETQELGLESGIQDQLASAYGGISFIEMHNYPHATVSPVEIPNSMWWEIENRLLVTYIGQPHSSSEIHTRVIAGLKGSIQDDPRLQKLRDLAHAAKDATYAADIMQLGDIFNANTDVQRALHPDLVCDAFEKIIEQAQSFDALGCKVNGAGGDGGSIAILTDGNMAKKRELQKKLHSLGFQTLPTYLSRRGLRVWRTHM